MVGADVVGEIVVGDVDGAGVLILQQMAICYIHKDCQTYHITMEL